MKKILIYVVVALLAITAVAWVVFKYPKSNKSDAVAVPIVASQTNLVPIPAQIVQSEPSRPAESFAPVANTALKSLIVVSRTDVQSLVSAVEAALTNTPTALAVILLGQQIRSTAVKDFGLSSPLGSKLQEQLFSKRFALGQAKARSYDGGVAGSIYTDAAEMLETEISNLSKTGLAVASIYDQLMVEGNNLNELGEALRFSEVNGSAVPQSTLFCELQKVRLVLQKVREKSDRL